MKRGKLVSFTDRGAMLLPRIADALPDALTERYARTVDLSLAGTSLSRFAQQAMVDCDFLVFVGAAGLAVRAVAPYLAGKDKDPAVLVIDEGGRFVIPVLSGHLGGANTLAERLAAALGGAAVITTATDGRGLFAADTWAAANGCTVMNTAAIRHISGALLRGDTVGLLSDFAVRGALPAQLCQTDSAEAGVYIGFDRAARPYAHTLHLVPRIAHIGIGCRRGASEASIARAVDAALGVCHVPLEAVKTAATIAIKRDEAGLLQFCTARGLPLASFTAHELATAQGDFTASTFVAQTVGVDNVCERAAVCAAGGGRLLCRKTALDGVTAAVAVEHWEVVF